MQSCSVSSAAKKLCSSFDILWNAMFLSLKYFGTEWLLTEHAGRDGWAGERGFTLPSAGLSCGVCSPGQRLLGHCQIFLWRLTAKEGILFSSLSYGAASRNDSTSCSRTLFESLKNVLPAHQINLLITLFSHIGEHCGSTPATSCYSIWPSTRLIYLSACQGLISLYKKQPILAWDVLSECIKGTACHFSCICPISVDANVVKLRL